MLTYENIYVPCFFGKLKTSKFPLGFLDLYLLHKSLCKLKLLLTLSGMGLESKKRCSSLEQPRGNFYKTGCQNNSIKLNFNLQKSLEIFEKISADKI